MHGAVVDVVVVACFPRPTSKEQEVETDLLDVSLQCITTVTVSK